eukprot:scaffold1619_cov292-Pavlova_lutheri.AAC.10
MRAANESGEKECAHPDAYPGWDPDPDRHAEACTHGPRTSSGRENSAVFMQCTCRSSVSSRSRFGVGKE